jgi:hypothetical protein
MAEYCAISMGKKFKRAAFRCIRVSSRRRPYERKADGGAQIKTRSSARKRGGIGCSDHPESEGLDRYPVAANFRNLQNPRPPHLAPQSAPGSPNLCRPN